MFEACCVNKESVPTVGWFCYLPEAVRVEGSKDDIIGDGQLVPDEHCDGVENGVDIADGFFKLGLKDKNYTLNIYSRTVSC